MSEKIEVVVTNEFIGERLDVALSKILPKSRSNIQRALKEMGIKPSMKVKDTMKFELTFTEEESKAAIEPRPIPFKVLYEDDDIIVIDKPAPWSYIRQQAIGTIHWSMACYTDIRS